MLSMYEKKSVQYLIDHSNQEELDCMKVQAELELETINEQCHHRHMKLKEARAFDFATEVLAQLGTGQYKGELFCTDTQPNKLTRH